MEQKNFNHINHLKRNILLEKPLQVLPTVNMMFYNYYYLLFYTAGIAENLKRKMKTFHMGSCHQESRIICLWEMIFIYIKIVFNIQDE